MIILKCRPLELAFKAASIDTEIEGREGVGDGTSLPFWARRPGDANECSH